MKILVAEDDPGTTAMLMSIFTKWPDHQVTFVADGQAALTLLKDASRWFDVLLLDVQMPELTGFEVLARIRDEAHLRSLEIIMCTLANERGSILKAVELGARHYLIKPPTEAAIADKLGKIAAKR